MPKKLIPGTKRTPVYKKSSGFKMKSPLKALFQFGGTSTKIKVTGDKTFAPEFTKTKIKKSHL